METKDMIKLEEEFEAKTKEYQKYKRHIERLEQQHVLEAKKIIDKLLLQAYLKAEDKEKFLEQVENYYSKNVWWDYYNPRDTLLPPSFRPTINLFEYFFQNDSSFRRFYGFDNEVNWNQVYPFDKRLKRFEKDLCKLFFSSFFDVKWGKYEKNIMFSLVDKDFIDVIMDFGEPRMRQFSHTSKSWFHYDSSHDYNRDRLGVKKYIESLNPNIVFADDNKQEETIEQVSTENSELEQQIAKIRSSHFPDEYKEHLIAELEQGDSQRGDGRTSGRTL